LSFGFASDLGQDRISQQATEGPDYEPVASELTPGVIVAAPNPGFSVEPRRGADRLEAEVPNRAGAAGRDWEAKVFGGHPFESAIHSPELTLDSE
jgi:hypothetical protein